MRIVLVVALAALVSAPAHAVNLYTGNRELALDGTIDFDTADDTLISLSVGYGVFVADFFQVGVQAGFSDSDTVSTWRLDGTAEYNFFTGQAVVPFVGGSVGVAGSDIDLGPDLGSDESGFVFGFSTGAKVFLTDSVAIATELGFDFATEDLFAEEDDVADTNWDLTLGLRFYF